MAASNRRFPRQRIASATIAIAVLLFALLAAAIDRQLSDAVHADAVGRTDAASATTALAMSAGIVNDQRLADALAGTQGTSALISRQAGRAATAAVEYADLNIERANPQILAIDFYDRAGNYVIGLRAFPGQPPAPALSLACDAARAFCVDGNPPADGYLRGSQLPASFAGPIAAGHIPAAMLSFGLQDGAYGSLYVAQPVRDNRGVVAGAVALRLDAGSIIAAYLHPTASANTLILSGDAVLSAAVAAYHSHGEIPVGSARPSDLGNYGGLTPVLVDAPGQGSHPSFVLQGTAYTAGAATVPGTDLRVVCYTRGSALSATGARLLIAVTLAFAVLLATIAFLGVRLSHNEQETALLLRVVRGALREDSVAVSRAIDAARTSDHAVRLPDDARTAAGLAALDARFSIVTAVFFLAVIVGGGAILIFLGR